MTGKLAGFKKIMIAALIVLTVTSLAIGALNADAAESIRERGKIKVNAADFSYVHSTTDSEHSGYKRDDADSNGNSYMIYYQNNIFDHSNIGCTYRSNKTYDMTDVSWIGIYGYTDISNKNDIMLYYVNPKSDVYYHNKYDEDKLTVDNTMGVGNGGLMKIKEFHSKNKFTYKNATFYISPRYTNEYVYLGLAHSDSAHKTIFWADNDSINSDYNRGHMSLGLVAHEIKVMKPDKATRIVVDEKGNSKEETYEAFGDIKLALADGKKYGVSDYGVIFRDESATLSYSLTDKNICDLKALQFYRGDLGEENKTLVYEMDVSEQENQCTFVLTSDVIKEMEKELGARSIKVIMVKPVFESEEITFDFSDVVAESGGKVTVAQSAKNSDGSSKYVLKETDTGAVIGTFNVNQASRVGDTIAVDFTENKDYQGEYTFRYYEYRMSQDKGQISGSAIHRTGVNDNKLDLQQKISKEQKYFWLSAHVALKSELKLEDKTTVFNNEEVKIDDAQVSWIEGNPMPTGTIRYHYYTDEACSNEMPAGEFPVNAGTYYVKAVQNQDDYYDVTESNTARIIIDKATPVLKNLKAEDAIVYGQSISETKPSGTAETVSGQLMTGGTFEWADESYIPETAGTVTAEVIYTPQKGSLWEQNYKEATGVARVSVNKAKPTIELEAVTKVYDAQEVTAVPATVKGVAGEATGQKINYQFYKLQGKKYIEMTKSPVNAGSYYVSAYVASDSNYAYAESDKVELTIKKRDCDLVPVPVRDRESYYVYITNTVNKPQGTMKLQMGSLSVSGLETREINGRCFAAYKYNSQNIKPSEDHPVVVTASYEPVATNENYNIRSNTLVISEESTVKNEAVEMTYGDGELKLASYDDWDSVKWINISSINSDDVVRLRTDGKEIYATALNAGTATLAGYIKNTEDNKSESRYVFFDITVNPAEASIVLDKKEAVYCGAAVCSEAARVVYESAEGVQDITAESQVSYTYYRGKTRMYRAPVNAGEYLVKAETAAQRNYKAAECIRRLIINPAEPDITMADDKVTYDGRAHGLEPPVIRGIDGVDINSEEASQIAAGRLPAGKVVYRYSCDEPDYSSIKKPTDAGEYTVTAVYIPGKDDNYAQTAGNRTTAKLTISPAPCKIRIKPLEMTYTGLPARHNPLYFTGIDGIEKRIIPDDSYVYMYSTAPENIFTAETPSEAGLYYVYAVKKAGGNYMRAVSDRSTLYIKQADVTVKLQDGSTVYSGEPADMAQINPATVTGRLGRDITDQVEVTYRYYSDPAGMIRIKTPVNAGTYYVQAVTTDSRNYTVNKSEIRKLTIRKAAVVLSQIRGTDITYGTAVEGSQVTGVAAGVKGEEINGEFAWSKLSGRQKPGAGEYDDLTVIFTPDEEAAANYRTTRGKASLTVRAFTPVISDENQSKSYNGEVQQLDEVDITGAEGMPAPEGDTVYTYFKDQACTEELSQPGNGVTDAGTYYCRIEFKSETPDYTDASSVCRLEILRADAAISLYVPTLGKNISTGEIKIKGILAGVFDDPTGTVAIYQKDSSSPDSDYVKIADGIEISSNASGSYGFDAEVTVSRGVYDFKAVYTQGSKQNYNICDGICEAVDMSKEPQSIYFEPQQIKREYGTGDISLNVVDKNNGPGEITYRVIENIGTPEAVVLLRGGRLKIRDTGKAFVMAVKAGDSRYAQGYAIAAVDIVKAKTKITVFDQRLTYTGQPAAVKKAVVTSNGSLIKKRENIRVVNIYKNISTGERSAEAPVNAGIYSIKAFSRGNDHYLPSVPDSARLVITKAKASISMKVKSSGKKHKTVTIAGTVSGLFDNPSGTISLYKKLSRLSDDAYRLVDSGIEITQSRDGSYAFEAVVPVMTDKVYDLKAVYEDGRITNYRVSDGILRNVSAGSDPVPSGDDDSKDDDDADVPDDGGKNDDDKNDDVTPVDPGNDEGEDSHISDDDDKTVPDSADKIDDRSTGDDKAGDKKSEDKGQKKADNTIQKSDNDKSADKGILADDGFVRVLLPWFLILLLIIIIVVNIIRRKTKKDREGEGK